jgi:hypothetical protein
MNSSIDALVKYVLSQFNHAFVMSTMTILINSKALSLDFRLVCLGLDYSVRIGILVILCPTERYILARYAS